MRILTLLLAWMMVPAALAGTPLPDAPHVVVSGSGTTEVAPDRAVIRLAHASNAADAARAKQAADESVNRLLDVLGRLQIAPADVTAGHLRVEEDVDYDDDGRRLSNGFVGNREVKIVLRDLARFNQLLDEALAAGMNSIEDIRFESASEDTLRQEARRKAVADATSRARALAEAFSATLGPVYSINSVISGRIPGYGAVEQERVQVTGSRINRGRYIQPRIEFTESVSVVFELNR